MRYFEEIRQYWNELSSTQRSVSLCISALILRFHILGAEIVNYNIEYRVQGKPKWDKYPAGHLPDRKTGIQNLKEDTYYEFRVQAENKAGTGPWSDPSQPVKTQTGNLAFSLTYFHWAIFTEINWIVSLVSSRIIKRFSFSR